MEKRAPWEIWFERHRGTELAELVMHLTRVALEKGHVTAEDAHCIPVTNPAIRGAAMRRLRAFGFIRKDVPIVGTTEKSHGHTLFKWVLSDPSGARGLLRSVQRVTLRQPVSEPRFHDTARYREAEPTGQLLLCGVA